MSEAETAGPDDVDQLVDLQCALFREDGAVHDRFVDVRWALNESAADISRMLSDARSLVLVVRSGDVAVGYLAGYFVDAPPTRFPGLHAVLRSLYVRPDHRGLGLAGQLIEAFVRWAGEHGCVQVGVDFYMANEPARRLYERHGFLAQSLHSVRTVGGSVRVAQSASSS
jgi:GNAT superfamily N-acetyltransferase